MAKLLLLVLSVLTTICHISGFKFRREDSDCQRLEEAIGNLMKYLEAELPDYHLTVVQNAHTVLGDHYQEDDFWCKIADVRTVEEYAEVTGLSAQEAREAYRKIQRMVNRVTRDPEGFVASAPTMVKDFPRLVAKLNVLLKEIGIFNDDLGSEWFF